MSERDTRLERIVQEQGYTTTHFRATHAICTRHGVIVPIDSDDHMCNWIKTLVRSTEQQTESEQI